MTADLQHIRDWMARVPGSDTRSPHGVIGLAFTHLETLLAEVVEHRAARGIEAPAGWHQYARAAAQALEDALRSAGGRGPHAALSPEAETSLREALRELRSALDREGK